MNTFNRVEIQREVTKQLPDNDVLLVFFDDAGAYAFEEWWRKEGTKEFYKWLEINKEFNYLCSECYDKSDKCNNCHGNLISGYCPECDMTDNER